MKYEIHYRVRGLTFMVQVDFSDLRATISELVKEYTVTKVIPIGEGNVHSQLHTK